jgi:hypothetical protein
MPDREELEERLEAQLETVLLSREQLEVIHGLLKEKDGMEKVNRFLNEMTKGGEQE